MQSREDFSHHLVWRKHAWKMVQLYHPWRADCVTITQSPEKKTSRPVKLIWTIGSESNMSPLFLLPPPKVECLSSFSSLLSISFSNLREAPSVCFVWLSDFDQIHLCLPKRTPIVLIRRWSVVVCIWYKYLSSVCIDIIKEYINATMY